MAATDIGVLLEEAKCYACYGAGSVTELSGLALLSRISESVENTSNTLRYFANGTITEIVNPVGAYDLSAVVDLTAVYINGAPALTDLTVLGNATLETVSIINQPTMGILEIGSCPDFKTLYAPNLISTTDVIKLSNNISLTSINLQSLVSSGNYFRLDNCDALLSLSLPSFVSSPNPAGGFYVYGNALLTSLSVPVLATVDYEFDVSGNPVLTALNFPSLISTGDYFDVSNDFLLASLSLPVLTSVGSDFGADNIKVANLILPNLTTIIGDILLSSTVLTSFSAPLWLATNGTIMDWTGCALDATSINHILARLVASGVTTCNVTLSGGTNAAPTGQGIIDKAALILAGNTVTTN